MSNPDGLNVDDRSELTPTQRVVESDFDQDTKIVVLRALMVTECIDCAREAHKALHLIEGAECGR